MQTVIHGLTDQLTDVRGGGVTEPTSVNNLHGERWLVLVVEDNRAMNRFIAENLGPDYAVVVAFNGREGLETAKALTPDLILTDMVMPEMSGDELVRAVRKLPELDATPIIVLTAKADDALRVSFLREGAQDYLTKPFSIEELRARVLNVLSRKQLGETVELASLLEQAPDGIFVADLDGRYTAVNDAGCRMLGYARGEILGKPLELLPPEDVAHLQPSGAGTPSGTKHVAEARLRRKDGTFVPVEISAKILPDGRWQGVVRDISERKALEAALRAKQADLVRAQSVARVGSWRLDLRRNVLEWSDETYRVFNVPLGTQMTYERFLACVHPDDRAFVDRAWRAALRGQPYDIEHRVVADGRVKWVREKADLELDEHREVIGGIGITQDITERKQYEEELREARERFELALRGADLGAWDWSIETGRVVFNPRWAEMRGYRVDEITPHVDTWIAGVHPEDWPRVQERLEDYLRGHAAEYSVEHRVRTKSGNWIWILDRGKVFARNPRGEPIRMVGTQLDITSRKRAEDDLRLLAEAGKLFASTLDYEETLNTVARVAARELGDFCILDVALDGETRRQTVESRAPEKAWVCDLFKQLRLDRSRPHLTKEAFETRRTTLFERVTPKTLRSLAQSEDHLSALQSLEPKSMMVVPLLVRGEPAGAVAFISSTESRVYRPSDVQLAEELAQRAAVAIENARLYRLATRAIRAREEVLRIVAHDLRNPLSSILMQAGLLRRSGGAPERRSGRPAEVIERAARRMNRLIQDLLDITRLDSGSLSLDQCRVPATELILDSCDAHKTLAASASIDLRRDVSEPLPEVWGDRDRLLQVLENLIGNAVKFTHAGGSITVGAAPRAGEVLFWVADDGAGIAAEDLPHVFDEFWQAKSQKRHGTGLGLPIVRGIVEAHGGRVWAESTLGRGAIFFFTIPTAATAEQWRAQPAV